MLFLLLNNTRTVVKLLIFSLNLPFFQVLIKRFQRLYTEVIVKFVFQIYRSEHE